MNWLITGGCGFIGRSLISQLVNEPNHSIRVLDNLSVGSREDLEEVSIYQEQTSGDWGDWAKGLTLIEGDILDETVVNNATKGADIVIHLAANTGVGPSVEDPMSDCKTNVIGTLNMLEACRKNSVSRFVFASSGAPLGVQTPPLNEEMAPHPASPYGASKLAGEGYCSAYFHCFGVDTVVLRFGNVYGEGSKHKASVVAKFIKLAMNGQELEVYGDGSQTRDFIHISDLVKAVYKAATVEGIGGEVFQIATSAETTVSEIVDLLVDALVAEGIEKPTVFNGEKRDGDVQRNFSDTSKAKKLLGWQAEVGLEEGLARTIRFFKEYN
ncbi:NAD-dependent epimerase/dehydratase family protein [Neptuniibacter sp. PT8_73]|uniref:NAD-dependent epimerase/dehydratase family protein n=1 Tax=unclassified Neptuniibacter TaxID=2630693 RepID=UPI0039F6CDDF